MTAAVTAVLALIQQLLPLIVSGGNASIIASIIDVLTKWLPIIVVEVQTLYQPVKNIIAALQSASGVTADQVAALNALDAAADAAFEAATLGLDPDAPAAPAVG